MQQNRSIIQTATVMMFVATFDPVAFIKIWIQGWPSGVLRMESRSLPSVQKMVTVMVKPNT